MKPGYRYLVFCAFIAALDRRGFASSLPRAREPLTVHDVGEYAAVPWEQPGKVLEPGSRGDRVRDLTFGVSSVNLSDEMTESDLARWADVARWGKQQGRKFLPRVYFWDGSDRYEGAMRDIEVYWRRLDRFLEAMDLSDLHGIVLAEENVHYAGRPEVLAELYRRVKGKYDVAVWQWWSPSTAVPGSGGWIPADGWVVDPYFMPKGAFRRYLQRYLITGLPVVVMPWASDERTVSPEEWKANEDQLEVAIEFGLPVAFYWVSGTSCYFPGDRKALEKPIDRINRIVWQYIERVRSLPRNYTGLLSADSSEGEALELGPVESGNFVYADDFATSQCMDHASMTGFRNLVLDGQSLSARGFLGRRVNTTLTHRFAGDLAVRYPEVALTAEVEPSLRGRVEIALSLDGRAWRHKAATGPGSQRRLTVISAGDKSFATVKDFWVRVTMSGKAGSSEKPPCRIDDLRVAAPILSPRDKVAVLQTFPGERDRLIYEDRLRTRKYLLVTSRTGDEHLEWSTGQIGVRMRPGGSKASLVWRVTADRPVQNLMVEVIGWANNGSLGTNHYLDVSTDGASWSHGTSTEGRPTDVNGWVRESLTIDLAGKPDYTGVRTFYVRLRMVACSYEKVHQVLSGVVTGLVIKAKAAQPVIDSTRR